MTPLSRAQFWAIVAVAVTHFLLGQGAVWRDPSDIRSLLGSIAWSYVPIPFMVVACLAWSRRLTLASWLIGSVEVAAVKYAITASFMILLWALAGPGERQPLVQPPRGPAVPARHAPQPTLVAAAQAGAVTGQVVDGTGAPLAGALVHVSAGLEAFDFAPPPDAVRVDVGAEAIEPKVSVAQVWQALVLRSVDGRLHAVRAMGADGRLRFNYPALPDPMPRDTPEALGLLTLTCAAHEHVSQRPALLLVTSNGFHAWTDASGHFRFEGVPAAAIDVTAWVDGRESTARVEVTAQADAAVRLVVE